MPMTGPNQVDLVVWKTKRLHHARMTECWIPLCVAAVGRQWLVCYFQPPVGLVDPNNPAQRLSRRKSARSRAQCTAYWTKPGAI